MGYPSVKFFEEGDPGRVVLLKIRALEYTLREGDRVLYTYPDDTVVGWKIESVELHLYTHESPDAGRSWDGAAVLWVGVSDL